VFSNASDREDSAVAVFCCGSGTDADIIVLCDATKDASGVEIAEHEEFETDEDDEGDGVDARETDIDAGA